MDLNFRRHDDGCQKWWNGSGLRTPWAAFGKISGVQAQGPSWRGQIQNVWKSGKKIGEHQHRIVLQRRIFEDLCVVLSNGSIIDGAVTRLFPIKLSIDNSLPN